MHNLISKLYLCIIYEWITLSHRHESIPYSAMLKYDTIIMQNCLFRLKLKYMLLCQTKHTLYLLHAYTQVEHLHYFCGLCILFCSSINQPDSTRCAYVIVFQFALKFTAYF